MCIVGYLSAFLISTHWMPITSPVVTIKKVASDIVKWGSKSPMLENHQFRPTYSIRGVSQGLCNTESIALKTVFAHKWHCVGHKQMVNVIITCFHSLLPSFVFPSFFHSVSIHSEQHVLISNLFPE